jgi:REP element-mobilizing transposase RayT
MPRRPRVFAEGLIYHVYNRVGRGKAPFKAEDEAERFSSLLREVKERDGLSILAWCIMPGHYHLAVRTGAVPLWRSIRTLQHRYAQGFNRRRRVSGPLWQARYKAHPVQEQESLLRAIAYIHLGPVAAAIVDEPGSYRWSGHREIVDRGGRPLVDRDLVLSLFGGARRQALRAYRVLLEQEGKAPWLGERLEKLPWWRDEPPDAAARHGLGALGRSAGLERRRMSTRKFLKRACPLLGVSIRDLASVRRDPAVVEARDLAGVLAVERWGIGVKALADALGKSRDGVSLWVRRGADRRRTDPDFADRLDDLDRGLAARRRK